MCIKKRLGKRELNRSSVWKKLCPQFEMPMEDTAAKRMRHRKRNKECEQQLELEGCLAGWDSHNPSPWALLTHQALGLPARFTRAVQSVPLKLASAQGHPQAGKGSGRYGKKLGQRAGAAPVGETTWEMWPCKGIALKGWRSNMHFILCFILENRIAVFFSNKIEEEKNLYTSAKCATSHYC